MIRVDKEVFGQKYDYKSGYRGLTLQDICTAGGDFLLRTQYMNLRIEDIIPEASTITRENLEAPIITPQSQTYDINNKSSWKNITIKNPNPAGVSETNYNLQVLDGDGKLVLSITEGCTFEGDSIVLDWDGEQLAKVAENLKSSGYALRVNAKCYVTEEQKDNYNSPSATASQIYYFKHPTHRIMIKALPYDNSGDPTITVVGSVANKNTWLTVGEGDLITLQGGFGNDPFKFNSFSTSDAESQKGVISGTFNPVKVNSNQYTISIPEGYADDEVVVYAWYDSPKIGVKTRVFTNYFNSDADGISWVDGKQVMVHKYEYSEWCSKDEYINTYEWASCAPYAGIGQPQFPSFVPEGTDLTALSFADKEAEDAEASSFDLYYPTGNSDSDYHKFGVDLTARIMSDTSTVRNYNAIVMVKKDNAYMTTAEIKSNSSSNALLASGDKVPVVNTSYYYCVVNGLAFPFGDGDILNGAAAVSQWYSVDGTSVLPAVSEELPFNNVIDKQDTETPTFKVVFFIVNKNTLSSIDRLTQGYDYVFKVEHAVSPNASKTGVDMVDVSNGLLIVGKRGCATFASDAQQRVQVYNVLGQQMCSFELNGSHTVSLPQGVYVANGQKFIVK